MTVSPKTERLVLIISAAITLLTLIACVAFALTDKSTVPKTDNISSEKTEITYKISVYDGKLAVFTEDSTMPVKVYDFFIASLPEEDQKLLISGITVVGNEELRKYIEDYTT